MSLQIPEVPVSIAGIFTEPVGIITSVVEAGIPPHQFEDVFQFVLVVPSQVPVGFIEMLTGVVYPE